MPRPDCIQLFKEDAIPILFENRSILAIDKPAGWMLVPFSWQRTNRNLQAALTSSIGAGHFWARSRGIRFLKYIHRLDADTTGVLLFARNPGALAAYGDLFETRAVEKIYLAVTAEPPPREAWNCRLRIAPDPACHGLMRADRQGKEAETEFRVLSRNGPLHLIEARPHSGRQHQIRVHMAESGCPVIGDDLYGRGGHGSLGLRAVGLACRDPFTQQPVAIRAPVSAFLIQFGFDPGAYATRFVLLPSRHIPRLRD